MDPTSKIALIAEDETSVRTMAAEVLIEAGFDVIEADNA
jgi:DNA-binding response OmpR family regulator